MILVPQNSVCVFTIGTVHLNRFHILQKPHLDSECTGEGEEEGVRQQSLQTVRKIILNSQIPSCRVTEKYFNSERTQKKKKKKDEFLQF